jgi:ABC-2 type transport system permease protein
MRLTWAVAVKELRQIRRDRRTLLILLFLPAFFLFLFGYALNFDIRHVSLAVEDRDQSPESRDLVARFTQSPYFDGVAGVTSPAEANGLVDRRRIRALLVVPDDFSKRVRANQPVDVQVVLDGDDANTASTVLGYTEAVLAEVAVTMGQRPTARIVRVEPRVWYNPELRSTLFLVPGLIAYIAMITAVVSTTLSIVKEKESGTMEQIRMAPIGTVPFVLGKTLPYLILSQASALLVVLAAMALFDMPMRGDWLALNVVLALFLIGAVGTGLLVSTMAESQQVAFQASLLLAFLPTILLSGFIFPIASMPVVLQYITLVVPARYFLVALRSVVLKGLPLDLLWSSLLALTIYALLVLALSAVRLARR